MHAQWLGQAERSHFFVHQRPATVVTFSFSDLLPSSISAAPFPKFDLSLLF